MIPGIELLVFPAAGAAQHTVMTRTARKLAKFFGIGDRGRGRKKRRRRKRRLPPRDKKGRFRKRRR